MAAVQVDALAAQSAPLECATAVPLPMQTQGSGAEAGKADTKRTTSKLRAKVSPEHGSYMGEEWLSSPEGQDALRRIAVYNPGRATPGRSTLAARVAVWTKLDKVQATGEATKANTDELLQRARGKIPEKRPDQTPTERIREIDQALLAARNGS